ncbi:MAG: replicative DNA helicase [Bradymonadales bacterium]|nr:replicative DNA helicase [Bradymonadales bacterium]
MKETAEAGVKSPPHDDRAEAALLGSILLDNNLLNQVIPTARVEHFYREAHREIYRAMQQLAESGQPIDTVTLSRHMKSAGTLKRAGGGSYLVQLSNETPAAINVDHYAKIVRDKALVRTIIAVARETLEEGYADPGDVPEFIERVQHRVFEATRDTLQVGYRTIREVIAQTFTYLETLQNRKERITGIATGYIDLDNKLSGLQPSDLIIMAGRPSMGKTALALNILANASIKSKVPVAIFSLEMSSQQLAMRMLCTQAKVSASDLRTGQVNDNDWVKILKAVGPLSEARIFIDETPALSALEFAARCRRLKQEVGIGLVVVDYLQLMRGSDLTAKRSREQEISEISRGLKALAKELNLPVVAVAQLNRDVENRPNKRPLMSDLRESGAIEQDADVIIFLYRDEYYHPETAQPGVAEVIVAKQRNGPIGKVELKFTADYTRFDNLAKEEQVPPGSPY